MCANLGTRRSKDVRGYGFRIKGLGFRVHLWLRVQGFGSQFRLLAVEGAYCQLENIALRVLRPGPKVPKS